MRKIVEVGAAVIRRENRILLASRPADKPPAGWEFPGGKREPGENFRETIRRELLEELGVEVIVGDPIYRIVVPGEERDIEIHFLRTRLVDETAPITARENQEWRWFELRGPAPDQLLPPDRPVWNFLTVSDRS